MAEQPALTPWAAEVIARYESGAAGQFILHGNVADRLLLPLAGGARLGGLMDFLSAVLLPRFAVVLSYDPGFGLRVERGQEIFAQWPGRKELAEWPLLPLPAVRTVARYFQFVRNLRAVSGAAPTVAVVLRDAQLWLPALPQALHPELNALASLIRSWASDGGLGEHGQAVFLVAERLGQLHPLVAGNPRAAAIEIPLPTPAELGRAIELLVPACPVALGPDVDRSGLARRLAGTTLAALEAFLRRRQHAGASIATSELAALRKELVERDAGELIDFLEPERTLDEVQGLERVKERLRQDIALWQRDEVEALPMGYLLCGPVGTGKTFLVECLAGEAGVPVVALGNFRDRWVGATEANLEKIFALLHALGRCIVFVDEADQALGRRGESGDSGVSGRVYSMLAAEMSRRSNRGKILWVLATSRPDLVEVDLKRPGRIDGKIPLFPCVDAAAGMALLAALCRRRGLVLDEAAQAALLPQVPAWLTPGEAEALAVKAYRRTRTGAVDPAAALRATLEDRRPPVDPAVIRQQMRLAAAEATDADFVPVEVKTYLEDA